MSDKDTSRNYMSVVPDYLFKLELSSDARLVVLYAVGRPTGWVFRAGQITKYLGLTETRWRSARDELVNAGYLRFFSRRSNKGRFEWIFEFVFNGPSAPILKKTGDGGAVHGESGIDLQEKSTASSFSQKEPFHAARNLPLSPTVRCGVVQWNETDRIVTERLIFRFGEAEVGRAARQVATHCEPLPSRVRKFLDGGLNGKEIAEHSEPLSNDKTYLDPPLASECESIAERFAKLNGK